MMAAGRLQGKVRQKTAYYTRRNMDKYARIVTRDEFQENKTEMFPVPIKACNFNIFYSSNIVQKILLWRDRYAKHGE